MVMKNNPLNSRFEICIVRGARGENVGAKCSNLATFGPFGLNNVARDDRSAKPSAFKPVQVVHSKMKIRRESCVRALE